MVVSTPRGRRRRRLRVGPDVELGSRGRVPLGDRAAHEHDALDVRAAGALEQQGDVRQRPGRDERDGDAPPRCALHEVDRMYAERRPGGGGGAVETALAVDVGGHGGARTSGRSAPAATGGPAADELEGSAEHGVVLASVWLPCPS